MASRPATVRDACVRHESRQQSPQSQPHSRTLAEGLHTPLPSKPLTSVPVVVAAAAEAIATRHFTGSCIAQRIPSASLAGSIVPLKDTVGSTTASSVWALRSSSNTFASSFTPDVPSAIMVAVVMKSGRDVSSQMDEEDELLRARDTAAMSPEFTHVP